MQETEIKEKEISERVKLCDNQGNLNPESIGWSRQPLHHCNLKGRWLRKKRWNFWCITNPDLYFSLAVSQLDYMDLAFLTFFEVASRQFYQVHVPMFNGNHIKLPETWGEVSCHTKQLDIVISEKGATRTIELFCPSLGGKEFTAHIDISRPIHHETMNVVIPWSNKQFQYTSKQNCLPATGIIEHGERKYDILPDNSFACLDFGRGIWPYNTQWNWSSSSGKCTGNKTIGWNLGGKWTDGTGLTENALCYEGHITKLSEDVKFEYDPANIMTPWKIHTTQSNRVDLTFTPLYEWHKSLNLLLIKSNLHLLIGYFSGEVQPDNTSPIRIDNFFGWAEEHKAKW